MEKSPDQPTTPEGLPIDKNGLPLQFQDEQGNLLSGREVVEAIRLGTTLEAIDKKPKCGIPEQATELPPINVEVSDALTDFDLQPKLRDPLTLLADFDINPRRRNQ